MQDAPKQNCSTGATAVQAPWHWIVLFLLPAVLLCAMPRRGAAEQGDGVPKVFRAGFLQNIFLNADPSDAKAVLEVHSKEITRFLAIKIPAKVVMFADIASMVTALRNGELEMVSLPAMQYLRIRDKVPLIPSFIGTYRNGPGMRYVIITRHDSGIRSFAELKGKSLLLPPVAIHEPSHLWLDVLLLRAGIGGRDGFFRDVRDSPKFANAIMAVFFRQADAAIVTRAALDTHRELNPQLETQVTLLAESPTLSDALVCMTPATPLRFRDDLYRALIRLNESTSGRQVYTIFQTNGITPFIPEHLAGLENLLQEQKRLKAKMTRK